MDQLIFSLYDLNIPGLKRVLCDDGEFFGKTKMAFIARLNSKFNQLKEGGICGISLHCGICLDFLPGCEIIEVRYALSENLFDENGMYWSQLGFPQRKGEVIIRFACKYSDGKVSKICLSRKFIPYNKKETESIEISNN